MTSLPLNGCCGRELSFKIIYTSPHRGEGIFHSRHTEQSEVSHSQGFFGLRPQNDVFIGEFSSHPSPVLDYSGWRKVPSFPPPYECSTLPKIRCLEFCCAQVCPHFASLPFVSTFAPYGTTFALLTSPYAKSAVLNFAVLRFVLISLRCHSY